MTSLHEVLYIVGAAFAVSLALAALGALFWAAGQLCLVGGNHLLTNGLRTIRITNWRYWSRRMQDEGITTMPAAYRELVAQRQPKTVAQWEEVDRESERQP